jgi:hypothetical protein
MNVYTYYQHIPELWSEESQKGLIDVWRRSWEKCGWNPIVLTEEVAKKHPRYDEFKRKFWAFPTPFGSNYEGTCFMRWVAMVVAGGGLMTDYDVINYGFPPCAPDPEKLTVICDKTGPVWCGAILGPAALFEGMCQIFYEWENNKGDWLEKEQLFHCEDQIFIRHMLMENKHPCPQWLRWYPGCSLYPKLTGPLVHYTSAAMIADKQWPKYAHVERLRPF